MIDISNSLTSFHIKLASLPYNMSNTINLYLFLIIFLWRFPAKILIIIGKIDEFRMGLGSIEGMFCKEIAFFHVV